MEYLNDRIGILLKYGKVLGSINKRFFYIDNSGNLYYTNEENVSKKFLETKNFNEEYLISIISPISKKINLTECSISPIKYFLEDRFNLNGRSYFELFLKTRDYRTILIFSWTEDSINFLRDYFLSISNINEMNCLNDQFSKYDKVDKSQINASNKMELHNPIFNNNKIPHSNEGYIYSDRTINNFHDSEYKIIENRERTTQKIFEFADVTSSVGNKTGNFKENLDSENKDEGNQKIINSFNDQNKNLSFKVLSNNIIKNDEEGMFLNRKNNILNRISMEFKNKIDNLNSKLHADKENQDEEKFLSEYSSDNTYADPTKNKIYNLNLEDIKHIEDLVHKLDGKYVNQINWDKQFIKIINPSQSDKEYEETWAQLDNGSDYSGFVINNMPNGYGKEYRKDGIFYTGDFKNGKWHGLGVITNVNLDTYSGEFVNGCICGI